MEIPTVPHRRPWSSGARVLLVVGVLTPVTLLALLPAALGLERYIIASDDLAPEVPRGSVAIERMVPLGDVVVGDVITFANPATGRAVVDAGSDDQITLVTREVVAVAEGALLTESAERPGVRIEVSTPSVSCMLFAVPLIGYPFLGGATSPLWGFLAIGLGLGAALLLLRPDRRPRRRASQSSPSAAPSAQAVHDL